MKAYHQGQLDFFCASYAFINAMRLLFGISLTQAREMLAAALNEISTHPLLWQALLCNRTDHHWVTDYMLGRFCGPGGLPVRAARLPQVPLNRLESAEEPELRAWLGLELPQPLALYSLSEQELYRPDLEFGTHISGSEQADAGGHPHRPWSMGLLWPLLQRWLPQRKFIDLFGQAHKQKRCLILRFHRYAQFQAQPIVSHWSTGQDFSKDTLNLYDCTASREATHTLALHEVALYPEDLDKRRYLALEPQSVILLEKI